MVVKLHTPNYCSKSKQMEIVRSYGGVGGGGPLGITCGTPWYKKYSAVLSSILILSLLKFVCCLLIDRRKRTDKLHLYTRSIGFYKIS